jgi:hypothetical protein
VPGMGVAGPSTRLISTVGTRSLAACSLRSEVRATLFMAHSHSHSHSRFSGRRDDSIPKTHFTPRGRQQNKIWVVLFCSRSHHSSHSVQYLNKGFRNIGPKPRPSLAPHTSSDDDALVNHTDGTTPGDYSFVRPACRYRISMNYNVNDVFRSLELKFRCR